MDDRRGGPGPSVADRIFRVLEACAESDRSITLAEFVALTGLPKTTLHRTCWKLVELGALDYVDGGYCVGARLFELGALNPSLRRLRATAIPYLHELCLTTGGVADLAVLSNRGALILEEVYPESSRPPRMLGRALPVYCTAVGKALIAGLPGERRDDLVGGAPLTPVTWRTIVDRDMLNAHLDRIAQTGISFSHEEWQLGVCGVASPVLVQGEIIAAIGFVGPPDPRLPESVAGPVRRAGRLLGQALITASRRVAAPPAQVSLSLIVALAAA